MTTIEPTSVVTSSADLLCTEVEGEFVMMDMTAGLYFNLDPIGSDIWRQLQEPIEVTQLCHSLQERYEAPAEVIERDVLTLLRRLQEKNLIDVRG